jgi:hypothetical protein
LLYADWRSEYGLPATRGLVRYPGGDGGIRRLRANDHEFFRLKREPNHAALDCEDVVEVGEIAGRLFAPTRIVTSSNSSSKSARQRKLRMWTRAKRIGSLRGS